MGRKPGDGRGRLGGRGANTPNKDTQDLQKISEELGIHPFKILLYFASGAWKALGYKAETYIERGKGYKNKFLYIKPELRVKAASEAAQYLYPKRKQVEIMDSTPVEQSEGCKKTFEEFCVTAGYPKAYPKQVEMMNFGMNETVPRIILGAPGYGKTDYVVILGVAYDIYLRPESSNLLMSKSSERNSAIVSQVAEALVLNGVILDKQNAKEIRVSGLHGKEASLSSLTIKAVSLRGRHPDRAIMEDVVTEDDSSEATRNLVEKKYSELLKRTNNVLVVGQPAHKHDLYAKLRPLLKKMEVPYGSIPELDHDLEAMKLAGVDDASIQASYHLNVVSEGTTPFDKIQYIDAFPAGSTSVAFIDPSDGGNDTAVSIFKQHMQGIAVVGFTWKKAWHHCLDDMLSLFKKYGVAKLCFETNKHGQQPLDVLRKAFPEIGVVGRSSNNNKHSRIITAGAYSHMIFLSKESIKNYIDQVVKYEYGAKVDDAPDSLATGLEWIGLIRGKQ